jgi:hypothetical protein
MSVISYDLPRPGDMEIRVLEGMLSNCHVGRRMGKTEFHIYGGIPHM